MKKILFAFAVLLVMAACTNKPVTAVENNTEDSEVAFEVAENYFFKNDQGCVHAPVTPARWLRTTFSRMTR